MSRCHTRGRALHISNRAILPHRLALHVVCTQLVLQRHVDALLDNFSRLFRSLG